MEEEYRLPSMVATPNEDGRCWVTYMSYFAPESKTSLAKVEQTLRSWGGSW